MLALIIILAFLAGLLFRWLGLPPLLGYLLAGFASHALGWGDLELLDPIADLGVTLLLFTIGLKLRIDELVRPYIIAPALLHMLIVIPLTAATLMAAGMIYPVLAFDTRLAPWVLAFALTFSSTVFAIKMFDERGENTSFYAAIAIGVLVIQDVLAVTYLVVASGQWPSLWALLLLVPLVVQRPFLRVCAALLRLVGHGELQLLFGFVAAIGAYELFEAMHLKGGLGALMAGVLIGYASDERARELYNRLVNLKNLFLIGFFLQIGYYGLPSLAMLTVASVLAVLLLLRPVIYFCLFTLWRLRARTASLAAAGLFTYSEFGLIVTAIAVEENLLGGEWLITLAVAIALSFFMATPMNKYIHPLFRRFERHLMPYEKRQRLPAEELVELGGAEVVVLGMGRVGRGAYRYLQRDYPDNVVGVEERYSRSERMREQGMHCVHGDASDRDFWEHSGLLQRKLILVSLSNHRENLAVVSLARELGFANRLAVTARFEDERRELEQLGCIAFNVYTDVGRGFAEYVLGSDND